jgi:hypothetical protein
MFHIYNEFFPNADQDFSTCGMCVYVHTRWIFEELVISEFANEGIDLFTELNTFVQSWPFSLI